MKGSATPSGHSPLAPQLIAEITLLPSAEGGRAGPILQGEFRGVLMVGEEGFSFRMVVPDKEGLAPGGKGRFGIQFLAPEIALPRFPAGKRFAVSAGRTVGTGEVLGVLKHA